MKLLLAAFPPELGPLLTLPPAGWQCACTGVGAISAAAATARLIAEMRPEQVVFLGSCGAYDPEGSVGVFYAARQVLAASLAEVRGEAYRPEIETVRWSASVDLPFSGADVVVPPAITRTGNGARALGTLGSLEHLELSGVFAACHLAGVPCGAALVVANVVGPEAHVQWEANHRKCSQDLITALHNSGFFERG